MSFIDTNKSYLSMPFNFHLCFLDIRSPPPHAPWKARYIFLMRALLSSVVTAVCSHQIETLFTSLMWHIPEWPGRWGLRHEPCWQFSFSSLEAVVNSPKSRHSPLSSANPSLASLTRHMGLPHAVINDLQICSWASCLFSYSHQVIITNQAGISAALGDFHHILDPLLLALYSFAFLTEIWEKQSFHATEKYLK